MTDIDLLKKFKMLPKAYSNKDVTINFQKSDFYTVDASTCENLRWLESGNTIETLMEIDQSLPCYTIFAVGDIAKRILSLADKIQIKARAITIYGTVPRENWTDEDSFIEYEDISGLLVKEILWSEN